MIVESLAGKKIAITGATGFLGAALVERLLRCVPDCELFLIVRPGRRGAEHRVKRDVLRNDAFAKLRQQLANQADHDGRSNSVASKADRDDQPEAPNSAASNANTQPAADNQTSDNAQTNTTNNKTHANDQPHDNNKTHANDQPHATNKTHANDQPHATNKTHANDQPHATNKTHANDQPHAANKTHANDQPHAANAQAARANETFEEMTRRRVHAIAGDVSIDGLGLDEHGRALLANTDIAIHAAATVSFDSALDDAVEVNLLGPMRVAATLNDIGAKAYLISVSTCYVAGSRRGAAPEELVDDSPFFVDVDWRQEVANARQARADAEQRSRRPTHLAKLAARARRELGAAGGPALADKLEHLRRRWVNEEMTKAGRARAASLGFPDAYAFTKALGERALVQTRGDTPVTIVRPSIIESALAEPRPGWIRGFRMAEPVIAAYARGLLKEFPGVPEGIVDVIPVDLVVSAIIAVAARGPLGDQPDIIQVATGSVNPLKYGQLVDLVRDWFTEHPVYDEHNQPICVPEWSFPGRGRVTRQLRQTHRSMEAADRVLSTLPLRGRHAEMSATLEERRRQLERAKGYVELYGAYAECEAVYQLDRLMELWDGLDDNDRSEFCFHPSSVNWSQYVHDIHLPSMVAQARLKMAPSARSSKPRTIRLRQQVIDPSRHLAVFDLENTLIASNVVASYSWLATRELNDADRIRFVVRTLWEAPRLLALDRRDRSDFLRYFYRRFEGAPVQHIRDDCQEMLSDLFITKSFPQGIRRVREHRRAGHRTLLMTGALDFVVQPLRPLFDHIVAAEMGSTDGTYDGQLLTVPPTGEARYQALVDFADEYNCDLRESVAYADSTSDLPMLEAVGFPVAVNPETKLASIARRRGWLIENWSTSKGAPAKRLPLAPRYRRHHVRHQRGHNLRRAVANQLRVTKTA